LQGSRVRGKWRVTGSYSVLLQQIREHVQVLRIVESAWRGRRHLLTDVGEQRFRGLAEPGLPELHTLVRKREWPIVQVRCVAGRAALRVRGFAFLSLSRRVRRADQRLRTHSAADVEGDNQ